MRADGPNLFARMIIRPIPSRVTEHLEIKLLGNEQTSLLNRLKYDIGSFPFSCRCGTTNLEHTKF